MSTSGKSSSSTSGSRTNKSDRDTKYYDTADLDEPRSAFRLETSGERDALLTSLQYHVEGLALRNNAIIRRNAAKNIFIACATRSSSNCRYGSSQLKCLVSIEDLVPVFRILSREGEDAEVLLWILAIAIYLMLHNGSTCGDAAALLVASSTKLLSTELKSHANEANAITNNTDNRREGGLKRKFATSTHSSTTEGPAILSTKQESSPSFLKRRKFSAAVSCNSLVIESKHDIFSIDSSTASQESSTVSSDDDKPYSIVLSEHLPDVWRCISGDDVVVHVEQLSLNVAHLAMKILTSIPTVNASVCFDNAALIILNKLRNETSIVNNCNAGASCYSFDLWLVVGFLEHYFADTQEISEEIVEDTCSCVIQVANELLPQLQNCVHDCSNASAADVWPVSAVYFPRSGANVDGLDVLLAIVKLLINVTHTANLCCANNIQHALLRSNVTMLSEQLLRILLTRRLDATKRICCAVYEKYTVDLLLCAVTLSCNIHEKAVCYGATSLDIDVVQLLKSLFDRECSVFRDIIDSTSLVPPDDSLHNGFDDVSPSVISQDNERGTLDGDTIESLIVAAHIGILQYTLHINAETSDTIDDWVLHIRVLKAYLALQEKTDSLSALQARQIVSVVRGMEGMRLQKENKYATRN